ncbi:MAG: FlaA1/EpsC-like NDP-sugar epimerase, partial [Lentimonas sp.]
MNIHSLQNYFKFRTLGLLLFYTLLCGISYFVAFQLRFDFNVPENFTMDMIHTIWWVVGLKLTLLLAFGQVDCLLSYFRLSDAIQLSIGLFIVSAFLVVLWYGYGGAGMPPRAVILTDFLLCFLLLTGFRVAMRVRASSNRNDWLHGDTIENVIIVGAGEVGAGICSELKNKTRFGMRPIAFLDDDVNKIGHYVHGVLVAGSIDQLAIVAKRYAAHKVIVAVPSAPVRRIREVVEMARATQLPVESVPAMTDLVSGRAKITQLHPIEMEDLLRRKIVDLNSDQIRSMLSGKRVLITGAGGSIGREMVAQILEYTPDALLCIDQAEIAIFNLQQEILQAYDTRGIVQTLVLDICQSDELETVFTRFKPEIIFHAAAHKHVSLMESQPAEALRNNFFATVRLARLASAFTVDRF